MKWLHAIAIAALSLGGVPATAQLAFDVASVKPSAPGEVSGIIKPLPSGRGYTAKNIPLKLMISLMYRIPGSHIMGGPAWVTDSRFDVEARTDQAQNKDDLQVMFKTLMADRFHLRIHTEIREGPVYALTVDPSGLKMKANTAPQDFQIPVKGPPSHITGVRVPMKYLCWWLGFALPSDARPVIDRTGLTGNYDFSLAYAPQPSGTPANDPSDLPDIFTALREQLGLRLHAEKGPVEYIVIDSVEKPSAD